MEKVCRKKQAAQKTSHSVKRINLVHSVLVHEEIVSKLEVSLNIQGNECLMELDTATTGNFLSRTYWEKMGCPPLDEPAWKYESASQHEVPVMGTFIAKAIALGTKHEHNIRFIVSDVPDLNLLGRTSTKEMGISVDKVLNATQPCNAVFSHLKVDTQLRDKCRLLCNQFPDLWKSELGCLTDFELDIKFKENSQQIFRKARPVPIALEEDLEQAYLDGIAKGV